MERTIIVFAILYFVVMIVVGVFSNKKKTTLDELNVGGRSLGFLGTSVSIAATWVWAPALLIASQQAYQNGILGLFWFMFANVLTLATFSIVVRKAVRRLRKEHTLAELMDSAYESKRIKNLYTFELLSLASFSTAVQLLAGASFINLLSGVNFTLLTIVLALIALSYSLLNGIKASVKTDVAQMFVIYISLGLAIAYFLSQGTAIQLGGINNLDTAFFSTQNWLLFIAFGFTLQMNLFFAPMGDPTLWQRGFSTPSKNVTKAFILSAFLFALVPFGTGMVGFFAAGAGFVPNNIGTVGLEFIVANSPMFVAVPFSIAIIAGLSSTIDSNMVAVGSLISKMNKRYETVAYARIGMLAVAIFGILIANIPNVQLFHLSLFYGVFRTSVSIPTIWTMLTSKLPKEKSIFVGTLLAMIIGAPLYAYGQFAGSDILKISASILSILIPLSFLIYDKMKTKRGIA